MHIYVVKLFFVCKKTIVNLILTCYVSVLSDCYCSSTWDGSLFEGTSKLLVQSKGILLGQNNGGHPVSGNMEQIKHEEQ